MNTKTPEANPRRVLIALDAAERSVAGLEEVARLAAGLRAELVGLFVEDSELLEAAALPMTRIMPSHARTPGALDAALMQRAFRIWSAETRKSLEAAALRWNLRWSYRVARGPVTEQLLAQVREQDLLALVATGRQRRSRSGLIALAVAARAPCSVFLLDRLRHAGLPVVVLYEGSPQALAIGRALAESCNSRLIVLALADSAEAAAALQASAQADLKETLDVSALAVGSASQIVKALQLRHPGVVVFQRSGSLAPQTETAVQAFDGSILALP